VDQESKILSDSSSTEDSTDVPNQGKKSKFAAAWPAVSVSLLLAIILASLVMPRAEGWKVCAQQLSTAGVAVNVCRPYQLTDVPVLCIIAILIIVGWTFVSQIGIPGFVTLTRRVSQTEEKVQSQGSLQALHEQRLNAMQLQMTMASAQATATGGNANANNSIVVNLGNTRANIDLKSEQFPPPDVVAPAEVSSLDYIRNLKWGGKSDEHTFALTTASEEAPLITKFKSEYDSLAAQLGLGGVTPVESSKASRGIAPEEVETLRTSFLEIFNDEIKDLELAETAASSGKLVSEIQLTNAIESVNKLKEIWERGLRIRSQKK
jgi:hypothetical protein